MEGASAYPCSNHTLFPVDLSLKRDFDTLFPPMVEAFHFRHHLALVFTTNIEITLFSNSNCAQMSPPLPFFLFADLAPTHIQDSDHKA